MAECQLPTLKTGVRIPLARSFRAARRAANPFIIGRCGARGFLCFRQHRHHRRNARAQRAGAIRACAVCAGYAAFCRQRRQSRRDRAKNRRRRGRRAPDCFSHFRRQGARRRRARFPSTRCLSIVSPILSARSSANLKYPLRILRGARTRWTTSARITAASRRSISPSPTTTARRCAA